MIKLAQPYIPEMAIDKCVAVIKSGNLVQGKYVQEFEQTINTYLGVKHAIAVTSGTAALHLSLVSLGIGPGDEVIVPAFSFPSTVNVVELVGAKPIFIDISLDDYCIDVSLLEKAITKKTKAIIPVHEFGQAANMTHLMQVATKNKVFVIEDAACALGSEYNNTKIGTIGNTGCFSFHPRKAITTGEGGVVVTNNDKLASKIIALRNHGMVKNGLQFDFIYAGFNYRMTDIQASLGIYQIELIETLIQQRIEQANYYCSELKEIEWLKIPELFQNRKMVFQSFHILLSETIPTVKFKEYLKQHEIESNIGAYSLPELSFYKEKYSLANEQFINAHIAYHHGLVLPLGKHITNSTINFIIDTIKKYDR